MRKKWLRLVALGVTASALTGGIVSVNRAYGEESAAKKHGPIAWSEKLDDAKKQATKEKKVIFVDFYADWCGPCQQMLKTTYKDKAVVTRSKEFVPVLINVDKQPALAEMYGVSAIPTVVFLDAKGKVLTQSTGYLESKDFLKLMDAARKKAKS